MVFDNRVACHFAQGPEFVDGIDRLYEQGQKNGVDVRIVSEEEAAKIEPLAVTHEKALWSPNTASAGMNVMLCRSRLALPQQH